MESISDQDIQYLIAVLASEESMLIDIVLEFEKWDCNDISVLCILKGLIEDDIILVSKYSGKEFEVLTKEDAVISVSSWDKLRCKDLMLYLTKYGESRWDHDDWGISTERAHHLMFSNNGTISRVR